MFELMNVHRQLSGISLCETHYGIKREEALQSGHRSPDGRDALHGIAYSRPLNNHYSHI